MEIETCVANCLSVFILTYTCFSSTLATRDALHWFGICRTSKVNISVQHRVSWFAMVNTLSTDYFSTPKSYSQWLAHAISSYLFPKDSLEDSRIELRRERTNYHSRHSFFKEAKLCAILTIEMHIILFLVNGYWRHCSLLDSLSQYRFYFNPVFNELLVNSTWYVQVMNLELFLLDGAYSSSVPCVFCLTINTLRFFLIKPMNTDHQHL